MKKMLSAAICATLMAPSALQASFHLVHITEIYSNADGTIQFIELEAEFTGQTQLQLAEIIAFNADGSANTTVININSALPTFDQPGDHCLLATASAQTAMGFAADYTIPNNSILLTASRIRFQQDGGALVVDAVAYGSYTGSNTGFGTPAAALPTDGILSLSRTADTGDNSTDFTAQTNSPTNSLGQTTSLGSAGVSEWDLYE